MKNGWVKIHRKIWDNPLSKKPKYLSVWLYLLCMANHQDNQFIFNNKKQICKKGQILTGRKQIAENTGICQGTIETILNYLETQHQIQQQKTNKFRLISVLNYNQYQEVQQHFQQQTDNKLTTNLQQTDTNNNDNNVKNVKNEKNTLAETSSADNSPFSFNETLENWINGENKLYSLIGRYFKSRQLTFNTKEQMQTAAKRHLRAAKSISVFSDDQIQEAIAKIGNNNNINLQLEWTLETVLKYLTK